MHGKCSEMHVWLICCLWFRKAKGITRDVSSNGVQALCVVCAQFLSPLAVAPRVTFRRLAAECTARPECAGFNWYVSGGNAANSPCQVATRLPPDPAGDNSCFKKIVGELAWLSRDDGVDKHPDCKHHPNTDYDTCLQHCRETEGCIAVNWRNDMQDCHVALPGCVSINCERGCYHS